MYHCFLIHSSVDGHLGCFYVLAIVNSAAMNTRVHVSLSILVLEKTLESPLDCKEIQQVHSEGCLFTLLIVSFVVQKLLSLIRSHLFIFAFISNILGGGS